MVLLLDLYVVTVQMLTDGAMGLDMERLQWSSYHPQGCQQEPSSSLYLRCSCSSCWAAIWFSAQHAKVNHNLLCKLWWFNSYGKKWLNFLSCDDEGRVRALQGRDKTRKSTRKCLGHGYLIHFGIFELFNLHAQASSQEQERISIELENSLCLRSISLIYVRFPA